MTLVMNAQDRFDHGVGPQPRAYEIPDRERAATRTATIARLRADLTARGWSAEVDTLPDPDRAEMQRDYGLEA